MSTKIRSARNRSISEIVKDQARFAREQGDKEPTGDSILSLSQTKKPEKLFKNLPDVKICAFCKEEFPRPPDTSDEKWESAKYCGIPCFLNDNQAKSKTKVIRRRKGDGLKIPAVKKTGGYSPTTHIGGGNPIQKVSLLKKTEKTNGKDSTSTDALIDFFAGAPIEFSDLLKRGMDYIKLLYPDGVPKEKNDHAIKLFVEFVQNLKDGR